VIQMNVLIASYLLLVLSDHNLKGRAGKARQLLASPRFISVICGSNKTSKRLPAGQTSFNSSCGLAATQLVLVFMGYRCNKGF
jgi:hypothetical protein